MQARQRGKDGEAVPTSRPTYSGIIIETSAIDDLMSKLRATLAEADYHAANALDLARKAHDLGGIDDAQLGHIVDVSRVAHAIALWLSPHRAALLAEGELPLGEQA